MELELNKMSFLEEFTRVRSVENRKSKDRSAGFKYLHNITTKKLAKGKDIDIGNIDFTKFTYADLEEYIEYFDAFVAPKINKIDNFFNIVKQAESIFSPTKRYY